MDLESTNQSITDLTFFLYRRPLHPELFRIYRQRQVRRKHYEAHVWIVGCAHVIQFSSNGRWVTELMADEHLSLPQQGLVEKIAFRGEQTHQRSIQGQLRYTMSFQVEQMSEPVFGYTYEDLSRMDIKRGLSVRFEDWAEGGAAPFTCVELEPRDRELHVQAFHVFPSDLAVVKTQSIFEVPKRK